MVICIGCDSVCMITVLDDSFNSVTVEKFPPSSSIWMGTKRRYGSPFPNNVWGHVWMTSTLVNQPLLDCVTSVLPISINGAPVRLTHCSKNQDKSVLQVSSNMC